MKKLHRAKSNRMLLGVSAGMGDYFETDPTLIRLVWAGLGLLWGYGALLYLLAAFLVPLEASDEAPNSPAGRAADDGRPTTVPGANGQAVRGPYGNATEAATS